VADITPPPRRTPYRPQHPTPGLLCSATTAEAILRAARDRIVGFTMAGRTWPREHTADLMRLLLEIDNEVGFLAT
jgi:hypothetical protein